MLHVNIKIMTSQQRWYLLLHYFKKNLAIANRSRVSCAQYAEGIYRYKYYTVTLKSRLMVTHGHWKRNHWIDQHDLVLVQLLDVEYYCYLEMWVRGH